MGEDVNNESGGTPGGSPDSFQLAESPRTKLDPAQMFRDGAAEAEPGSALERYLTASAALWAEMSKTGDFRITPEQKDKFMESVKGTPNESPSAPTGKDSPTEPQQ